MFILHIQANPEIPADRAIQADRDATAIRAKTVNQAYRAKSVRQVVVVNPLRPDHPETLDRQVCSELHNPTNFFIFSGDPGAPGSCDHCPPARLAPGYFNKDKQTRRSTDN
jgi:hypothetical protein